MKIKKSKNLDPKELEDYDSNVTKDEVMDNLKRVIKTPKPKPESKPPSEASS